MPSWIKEVPVAEIVEAKTYFIARKWIPGNSHTPSYLFHSRLLNGKSDWTSKPGIGIHYVGGAALMEELLKDRGEVVLVAIEVPADASKRWKARRRRLR